MIMDKISVSIINRSTEKQMKHWSMFSDGIEDHVQNVWLILS